VNSKRSPHATAGAWSSFFEDAGISGAKGRDKRPGLDRLLKAVARRDVDMVAAWSVDRLGRSLIDLLDFLRELHAKGVDLFLHQQGLDTSTPSGRAMFQMLGVFAEFERAMIRERVMAGLSRAKADGIPLGRRRLEDTDADKVAAIVAARATGTGIRRIARELGVGVGTVLRVTGEGAQMRRQHPAPNAVSGTMKCAAKLKLC
jgi:DNA invertase Pin-like site-specific DNA recombinase